MTDPIALFLKQQKFIVLDGALATELEQLGADLDDPLWSARCLLESPELVSQVHNDYLHAGADIIASATYQASEAGFRARGMSAREARALMKEGVSLAMRARDEFWLGQDQAELSSKSRLKPLVAASMGPFGACLHNGSEYHGNYDANWREVSIFHRERMLWLAEAGADLMAFETIPSLAEAEVLLELLEKHSGDLHGQRAWIGFSCKDEQHVSHGESFADCMSMLLSSRQVIAGGINCTAPELVPGLLSQVDSEALPLLVYPNSGEKWIAEDHCWTGQGDTSFDIENWVEAGARLIGGCCRTRPADISAIRERLFTLPNQPV